MNISLLLLTFICFIGMLSPGPDFILVTRNALIYPRRQALATALGIVSGCLFHSTYCILGLAFIIMQSVTLFSVIKYAGAAYLVYLGLKSFLSKTSTDTTVDIPEVNHPSVVKSYIDGLLCNVLNPKLAVFLLSLFTQFIAVDASIIDKTIVASIFVIESAIYWPCLVLLLQTNNVRWVFNGFRSTLNQVCGALLIYLGLRVAVL